MTEIIPRKAHVKRIKSANGTSWIDVLRIDEMDRSSAAVNEVGSQKDKLTLRWMDEEAEGANPNRVYEILPIALSGTISIDLPIVKSMEIKNSGQNAIWSFKNEAGLAQREVTKKRVYHTTGVPDATIPVDWEIYKAAMGAPGQSGLYIDVEVVDSFMRGNSGQRDTFHLKNDEVKALLSDGADENNSYRLDPFQTIVNVSSILLEAGYGIISAWRDGGPGLWQFEAQLCIPGAERYPDDDLGHGDFILGAYQVSLSGGCLGDYAYSSANRTDPPDDRNVNPEDEMILPEQDEMENLYLWHTGSAKTGERSSLIVNIRKILDDFGSPPLESLMIQIAGLGSATGWDFRIFERDQNSPPDPVSFSFADETKRVECSRPLLMETSGPLYPQIVNSANIQFPP